MPQQTDRKVPEIRFNGFIDSWKENLLGTLFPITSAARVHKNEWTESGVPFFRSSDVVSAFKGKPNAKAFISWELYEALSGKVGRVQKGDMLVTGGGSIGIPYLVRTNDPIYFKDADLLWFKIREAVDSHYLHTFFSSQQFARYLRGISHIGTIAHYTVEQAKATPLIAPSQNTEQIKIGSYFKSLDRMIELHQQKHDKLVALKQAMLQTMFPQDGANVPEIRFKGFEGDWVTRPLEQLVTFSKGQGYSKKDLTKAGTPIIFYGRLYTAYQTEISDVNTFVFEQSGAVKSDGNEVVVPASGETAEDIARASAVIQEGVILGGDLNVITPFEELHPCFLALSLSNGKPRQSLARKAQGKSVVHVRNSNLASIDIPMPDLVEQVRIGTYFRKLDELISKQTTQLEKLKNIKSGSLDKMFV